MINTGLNKFLAATFFTLIVVSLISFVGNKAINAEELENNAVKIAAAETASEAPSAAAPSADATAAEMKRGKKLSSACIGCHSFKKGGAHIMGPNLWNVSGADKGTKEGFTFSDAIVEFGGVWDDDSLDQFLTKPSKFIKGTKMRFRGLKKPEDRAILIKWMHTQSDAAGE